MFIAQKNFREKCLLADGSALARGAKPARAKTIRTIGDWLIKNTNLQMLPPAKPTLQQSLKRGKPPNVES
jgi:hypothetical protein